MKWKVEVAQRLKAAREGAGYTQPGFAELLGVEEKTYAKYERQKSPSPITQHLIGPICRILDLDPLVLLEGYGRDAKRGPKLSRIK